MTLTRSVAAFAAAIAGGFAAPASAQPAPPPMISVIGEATLSTTPDMAQFDAGVISEAKTAREASEANNSAMGKVLLALKSAGIEAKDLQTSRLSLQPQTAPNRSGPSSVVGYRASNRVTIRLRDVTSLANVVDTVVGAGANDVGGIEFSVSNPSKLLDEAREQAVADARRKAEIYAKAVGVSLGAPVSVAEGVVPIPYRRMAAGVAQAAPVAPGEETLQITVNISWAIKQAQ